MTPVISLTGLNATHTLNRDSYRRQTLSKFTEPNVLLSFIGAIELTLGPCGSDFFDVGWDRVREW